MSALLFLALAVQQPLPAAPPAPILLRHATLLDGSNPTPQRDVAITLRGGRIESVRPDHDRESSGIGARDSVIDLRGAWVVPGLIDAHAHLGVSHFWGEADSVAAQRALDGGVTTVRSMGNVPGFGDVALADGVPNGARLPRVLAAGSWVVPIVSEEWFGDFPTIRPLLGPATAADSALRLLPGPGWRLGGNETAIDSVIGLLAARGADWVKVFATGRSGIASSDPRTPLLGANDLKVAAIAARRRGLRVAAHAYTDEGIRASVLAGASTIEHGAFATEESLRLMRERGTCLVPTLSAYDEPSPDAVVRARAEEMRSATVRAVRNARTLGVPVIPGTDTPYGPGGHGVGAELLALAKAGLSPDEVLRAATSQAAACLGIAERTGRVTAGLEADLLVLDGDPRSDLSLLGRPRMVILGGRLVRRLPVAEVIHAVLVDEGLDVARERVRALHRSPVDSLRYGEYELIGLGARLGMSGRLSEALAMFEVNVEVYPEAPNAWDALGQAFLMVGRPDDARRAFARAVEFAEKQGHPRVPEFRARLRRVTRPERESQQGTRQHEYGAAVTEIARHTPRHPVGVHRLDRQTGGGVRTRQSGDGTGNRLVRIARSAPPQHS
jgi:imidazolonepropionase-like amidohydrolase